MVVYIIWSDAVPHIQNVDRHFFVSPLKDLYSSIYVDLYAKSI